MLGPAGCGKTFRCLTEIRKALLEAVEGPPLLLVAPKQTTYQLERQLLADGLIGGYTRLQILSFDRLARLVLAQLRQTEPEILDQGGRVMVLRALIAEKKKELKLFRASARLTGFAQELSSLLQEFQRHQLGPDQLKELSKKTSGVEGLDLKLQDLAMLLEEYYAWLKSHDLKDAESLLAEAAAALAGHNGENKDQQFLFSFGSESKQHQLPLIQGLWVDGFTDFSPHELDLLAALMPRCEEATITFCLDVLPKKTASWLSMWSAAERALEKCKARLETTGQVLVVTELLERNAKETRFEKCPALYHLERTWSQPEAYSGHEEISGNIRIVQCMDPEAEATVAAREIARFVRTGGRYREATVLVRKLEGYHSAIERVFSRYEIPFFLDRRQSVSHHPLAELTRSALRTVLTGWRREEWFAALKTGLVPASDAEIDRLETEALARGWGGSVWRNKILISDDPSLAKDLEKVRRKIAPAFQNLERALGYSAEPGATAWKKGRNGLTGSELSAAIRAFWEELGVEERLESWADEDSGAGSTTAVHTTVWGEMGRWLENVELAFSEEALTLREWVPILEAGLAGLTVGLIPPGLDQVLVGAIDRSRNPDVKLAIILGMNETVFPASPRASVLLTETDRVELGWRNVTLNGNAREQISRERFLAYLACTRARERLVLTFAEQDGSGNALNRSPFLEQVEKLFPAVKVETISGNREWEDSEHATELLQIFLRHFHLLSEPKELEIPSPQDACLPPKRKRSASWAKVTELPAVAKVIESLRHFQEPETEPLLTEELAGKLYREVLRSSVSRLEQFAACPFKFFIHSGLRTEDRKTFELDFKEQGNFQHEVLAKFHEELNEEGKRWRDVTPGEARERVKKIALRMMGEYREGLLQSTDQSRFAGSMMVESLKDFVEVLVEWMRKQYLFDPVQVELAFGDGDRSPAWEIVLGNGHRLAVRGRIDRVDLFREPDADEALCVVVDYKSSQKKLEPILIENGLQLQLLTYLTVLRHWPEPKKLFGVSRLVPAGVFYVNLQGKFGTEKNRSAALEEIVEERKLGYQHVGRFDMNALAVLDARPYVERGDMFNYRRTQKGHVSKTSREPMDPAAFRSLLDSVEANLKEMGARIFAGDVEIAPYRKGAMTACDYCEYQGICRIDPWTHEFRRLKSQA